MKKKIGIVAKKLNHSFSPLIHNYWSKKIKINLFIENISFEGKNFIIECKGRPNDTFPLRWKMFKKYVSKYLKGYKLYKPQRQSECDDVINLIKYG